MASTTRRWSSETRRPPSNPTARVAYATHPCPAPRCARVSFTRDLGGVVSGRGRAVSGVAAESASVPVGIQGVVQVGRDAPAHHVVEPDFPAQPGEHIGLQQGATSEGSPSDMVYPEGTGLVVTDRSDAARMSWVGGPRDRPSAGAAELRAKASSVARPVEGAF